MESTLSLVNPISIQGCSIRHGSISAALLDISFVRAVTAPCPDLVGLLSHSCLQVDVHLDKFVFPAEVMLQGQGDRGLRLSFEKIVPSAQASLRSFLSPKKIGESIVEDWRSEGTRHFHGLNESELWFNASGTLLFSYLNFYEFTSQFIVHVKDEHSHISLGKLSRADYIGLKDVEQDLGLTLLTEKEGYVRLSECRDIVTNFRPISRQEYHLKQRLLKLLSDTLYSSSHRFEIPARPVRSVSAEG